MSDRVKQHFVPQFYFRNFTENERVRTFNIDSEERYPLTHIKNICYERYFYGDGEVEESLQHLENGVAPIIHQIASEFSLDPIANDEQSKFILDLFITHLEARTKSAKEEAQEFTHNFFTKVVEFGVESGELDEDVLAKVEDGEITLEGPSHELRQFHAFYAPLHIGDLERILIQNESSLDFVTSDNPVYFDNPRFKNETELGTEGYATPGLQILCPLSSKLVLLYYDTDCYSVEKYTGDTVSVSSNSVVQKINNLQLINCLSNVYYSDERTGRMVDRSFNSMEQHRPENSVHNTRGRKYDPSTDQESELLITRGTKISYTPELPFIGQNPDAEFKMVRNRERYEYISSLIQRELDQ